MTPDPPTTCWTLRAAWVSHQLLMVSRNIGATTDEGGGWEPLACLSFPIRGWTRLLVVKLFSPFFQTKAYMEAQNVKPRYKMNAVSY